VLTIPESDELPDELVAPTLCGGVTAYKALKACGATPGEWVAIVGAGGGVGGLGIQYAKAMGFRVAAVDIGPAKDSCIKMGADAYFDGASPATPAGLRKLTPNEAGAKAVIVTAGSGRAYQNALDLVAVFGTLVCVGIPPPDQAMSLHPLTLIDRGINLLGTLVGTRTETLEALEFVRRGVVKPVVESLNFDELDNLVNRFSKVCHPCRCHNSQLANLTRHRENWSFNSNHSALSWFFCSFAVTIQVF
jgi:propanol-preferring alcohol dehydrogenase